MPEPLHIPWNKQRLVTQTLLFVLTLSVLGFFCWRLGGWNAGAVAAMVACLSLFLVNVNKLVLVIGRDYALEMGPEGLLVNTTREPQLLPWKDIASCSTAQAPKRRYENLILTLRNGDTLTLAGLYLGPAPQTIKTAMDIWLKDQTHD
ncbi:hypothetical protein [Desulfovibrio ferrophilus]|uniref:PH domain-containing protein n=1 Tax=Desulfovibrio ferrophilus TaxID=241368 RepID=A0A2Z6B2P1_9BACT|nr:hypothetical protein [Desulfovibrio ferrophilus]BBD09708.1 uncharacterized protein DFE_2982 [Desulfovibrio ferrophilus]